MLFFFDTLECPYVAHTYFSLFVALLMEPCYKDLRSTVCNSKEECDRFRSMLLNFVMATDIINQELKDDRENRWRCAFENNKPKEECLLNSSDHEAAIFMEHLIQTAVVTHTMQQWSVYIHWNQRLFHECFLAYQASRSEQDPATIWYNNELEFFDVFIIPLAQKLKSCGMFGLIGDDSLQMALRNRAEFERRGQQVIAEMVESFCLSSSTIQPSSNVDENEEWQEEP